MEPVISQEAVCQAAASLFPEGPFLFRWMQRLRPHICPFEILLTFVPPSSSIMDIGCGGGLFLGLVSHFRKDIRGFGFDSSLPAIRCAEALAPRLNGVVEFRHVPTDQPWPGGAYDVVSIIDVMHHIPPKAQEHAFSEAVARLKPGGKLLYKDMCSNPAFLAMANRMHDLVIAGEWIHYVPIATVDSWAVRLHLEEIERGSARRYWYGHEYRVFRKPG